MSPSLQTDLTFLSSLDQKKLETLHPVVLDAVAYNPASPGLGRGRTPRGWRTAPRWPLPELSVVLARCGGCRAGLRAAPAVTLCVPAAAPRALESP